MIRLFPFCALALCGGVVAHGYAGVPVVACCGVSAAILAAAVLMRRAHGMFIALVITLFFLCGMTAHAVSTAGSSRRVFAYRLSDTCAVRGVVASEPGYGDGTTRFLFRGGAWSCGGSAFAWDETVSVTVESAVPIEFGEGLALRGKVQEILPGPGRRIQRALIRLRVPSALFVERLHTGGVSPMSLIMRIRRALCEAMRMYVRGVPGGILTGMIIGDQSLIPPLVIRDMVKSGTIHLLVISGSHVAYVVLILIMVLRLLRVPRRVRLFVLIPCLAAYGIMTGASPPVMRAVLMAGIFLAAYPLRREPDIHNAWAIALIILLTTNPANVYNLGFQLSFISVLAIIYVYPLFQKLFRTASISAAAVRLPAECALLSFSVWLATAGIIASGCRVFSPVTVIANLFLVPLAGVVTLCGFTVLIAAFICPAAAPHFGAASELLVFVMLKVNALLLKIPYAFVMW